VSTRFSHDMTKMRPPLASQIACRGSALIFATRLLKLPLDVPPVHWANIMPRPGEQHSKSPNPKASNLMPGGTHRSTRVQVQPSAVSSFSLAPVAGKGLARLVFISE
jgi:hypothetical protein